MNDSFSNLDNPHQGGAKNEDLALEASLKATPAQRLAWLEEVIKLAHAVGALPRK